jgi:gas vesicle protein
MTILDRKRGSRVRIDAGQFADELAKRFPDLDDTRDQAESFMSDAADNIRHGLDRAADFARVVRGDIAHSAEKVAADNPIDEIGQRIKAVASTTAIRALVHRLEKELPEVDRDKYHRAYSRGRAQARSKYLVVGIAAGVGTGVVAALLLDPKHGPERRAAIRSKLTSFTSKAGHAVSDKAKVATEKARGLAAEKGLLKGDAAADAAADAVAAVDAVAADVDAAVTSGAPLTEAPAVSTADIPASAG